MDGFTGFKTAVAEKLPDTVALMTRSQVVRRAGDAPRRLPTPVRQDTCTVTAAEPATRYACVAVVGARAVAPVHHRPAARDRGRAGGVALGRRASGCALSFAKVAEYQRRGAIHFHAIIRLDGPPPRDVEGSAYTAPEVDGVSGLAG